jgi:hypothetical protein
VVTERVDPNIRPNDPDEIDIELPSSPAGRRQLWLEKGYGDD